MDIASMVTPVSDALEFRLVKVDVAEDGSITPASKARIESLVGQFTACDGIKKLFYGQQLEDPRIVVFCAQSASDVPQLQLSTDEPGPWPTNGWLVPLNHDIEKVLAAPVMEVCTAFDCQPSYIESVRTFIDHIDGESPIGYRGCAYGETTNPLSIDEGAQPSKSANLLVGWDSMQAHEDAKAKPGNAIISNIDLLREGRGGFNMFHVVFHKS